MEAFDDGWGTLDEPARPLRTSVAMETCRSAITRNRSPDVPFDRSINPYRGCEHGCVYCFARPTHAYVGLSPGVDFESRLLAKPDVPDRLAEEITSPRYRCDVIALGTNTDPYQPIERRLRITRRLLEVMAEHRHPVGIVTKSNLVLRDLDILAPMAREGLATVHISVTTLDRALARRLEARAPTPERRLETIRGLSDAGVPTGVMAAPVIPALNDSELERILETARDAGARSAGYILVRLPREVDELFREWLDAHYPEKASRVMSLIRRMHGGRSHDATFGRRMSGTGRFAELLSWRFLTACRRLGLGVDEQRRDWSGWRPPAGRRPARANDAVGAEQLGLFGGPPPAGG